MTRQMKIQLTVESKRFVWKDGWFIC